jgi:hypothetical protein
MKEKAERGEHEPPYFAETKSTLYMTNKIAKLAVHGNNQNPNLIMPCKTRRAES